MPQTIITQFGEDRHELNKSFRVYFFGVSPTGVEGLLKEYKTSLKQGPSVTIHNNDERRLIQINYSVLYPMTIKMVMLPSEIGKMKRNVCVYLLLDENAPKIRIQGFNDWGMFEGRATVEWKKSTLNNRVFQDKAEFDRHVTVQLLDQPTPEYVEAKKKMPRKLIIGGI